MQEDTLRGATRVLLVDDDGELRGLLAGELAANGFKVDEAGSVGEAQCLLAHGSISVAILDVQLPDGSGFAVASRLRKQQPETGIIMLSRHRSPAWQIAGLDVGADTYLPKPIEGAVLVAAVRSLLRRLQAPRVMEAEARGWTFHDDGWQLVAPDGRSLALGAAERALLAALAARAGSTMARGDLLAALAADSGEESFTSHRLDMLVHRLRRKVEESGLPPLPLKAIRGQGLVLLQSSGTDEAQASGATGIPSRQEAP
ncbi:MAG: response regulator transcription factor [Xanthomonadales bacterium]|nr:response regulator transcription factor [Xanthomonadales bacterium]